MKTNPYVVRGGKIPKDTWEKREYLTEKAKSQLFNTFIYEILSFYKSA